MTPWRCCVQLHLTSHLCLGNRGVINWEGSLICHILNAEVSRLSYVHFVRAQSLFDNLISGAACCGKHRAVGLRMEVSCRQTETSVGKETGGCARLAIISSRQPAYALKKPCDARSHAHAKPRGCTFSSHASERISSTLWCPLLLPSVSFFLSFSVFPGSWFMFGLGLSMFALICLPFVVFPRPLFFLHLMLFSL